MNMEKITKEENEKMLKVIEGMKTKEEEELIERLQHLYDDNSLSDKDEDTILKAIIFLGGETAW